MPSCGWSRRSSSRGREMRIAWGVLKRLLSEARDASYFEMAVPEIAEMVRDLESWHPKYGNTYDRIKELEGYMVAVEYDWCPELEKLAAGSERDRAAAQAIREHYQQATELMARSREPD